MPLKPEIEEHTIAMLHEFFMLLEYATQPQGDGAPRTADTVAMRMAAVCDGDYDKIKNFISEMEPTASAFIEAVMASFDEITQQGDREENH